VARYRAHPAALILMVAVAVSVVVGVLASVLDALWVRLIWQTIFLFGVGPYLFWRFLLRPQRNRVAETRRRKAR